MNGEINMFGASGRVIRKLKELVNESYLMSIFSRDFIKAEID